MVSTVSWDKPSPAQQLLIEALSVAAKQHRIAIAILRAALVIVLVWIGRLKFIGCVAWFGRACVGLSNLVQRPGKTL